MASPPEAITAPANWGQISVLVVDPKSTSRLITTKLLQENGYKVCLAAIILGYYPYAGGQSAFPLPVIIANNHYYIFSIQVIAVQTGSEALTALQLQQEARGTHGIDAILKAHDPPASNGPRFLQKISSIEAFKALPVIGSSKFRPFEHCCCRSKLMARPCN